MSVSPFPWKAEDYKAFSNSMLSGSMPNGYVQSRTSRLLSLGLRPNDPSSLFSAYENAYKGTVAFAKTPKAEFLKDPSKYLNFEARAGNESAWAFNREFLSQLNSAISGYNTNQTLKQFSEAGNYLIGLNESQLQTQLKDTWESSVLPELASLSSEYHKQKSLLEMGMFDAVAQSFAQYGAGLTSDQMKYNTDFLLGQS